MDYAGLKDMMAGFGIYRHLGLELVSLDKEKAVMACTPGPEVLNLMGKVHGSVAFALMDTALGVCFVPHTIDEPGNATAEIKVNYLRPVFPDGTRLTCEARVLQLGKRTGVAEARVTDDKGRLVAVALGSVARTPVGG